jgi:hypothetical protein
MGEEGKRSGRMRRLLLAVPGLIAPAVLLAYSVAWFVEERSAYYALPVAVRNDPDPDPLSADAGMFLAGVAIVVTLLLFAPPLLAALPSRLRVWQAVVAILLQALPLFIAAGTQSLLGWLAFAGLAYVPLLVLVRLVGQHRVPAPPGSAREAIS